MARSGLKVTRQLMQINSFDIFFSISIFFSTLLLSPNIVHASDSPHKSSISTSVNGKIVFDNKSIAIQYGYALDIDNVEEAKYLFSSPQKTTVLVFTDRELPQISICDRGAPFSDRHSFSELFSPLKSSPGDKVHGVLLKLDASTFKIISAQLLFPGHNSEFTVMGADISDRIEIHISKIGLIAGTSTLSPPQNTGFSDGPKKYHYKINFQIPLKREQAITKNYEGKDALISPPLESIKKYLSAAKSGDVDGLRKLTAQSHLAYLNKPEVIKMLKDADASMLAEQVKRVVIRGDRAAVVVVNEKPNFSIVIMHLVLEKGIWKLYWP